MKKLTFLIISFSFLLTSCTRDPYTGEVKLSNIATYSAGGAVLGTIVGRVGGKSKKNTARGALIGVIAGGALGAYFDNQEQALRRELEDTGIRIQRNQNEIKLIMPGNITFSTDSSNINSDFYKTLNSIAKVFKKYKNTNILIEGFTDSIGTNRYNKTLSIKRAKSVNKYLALQGISEFRIEAYGRGENSPIASNKTSKGREQNRRVEINILPKN
jgi:outer membrane protein OmpA-like peptidoglycan-associated protein